MIFPDLHLEMEQWHAGKQYIAGIDEAGRGAWCGPVSAAAVILPADEKILEKLQGVRDSKLMSAKQRNHWAEKIKDHAICWQVAMSTHEEIDQLGIVPATRLAMQRAVEKMQPNPDFLLIDAVKLHNIKIDQTSLFKGDQKSLSIAAASVLAKTSRDALLIELSQTYPQYGFERHKGYGTRAHRQCMNQYGPCEIHRKSFAPVKEYLLSHPQKEN
jgi:ribonuclease HII